MASEKSMERPGVEVTPAQRNGMRNAILAQSCGTLAMLGFENGIVLLYLHALGLEGPLVMILLSVPWLAESSLRIPLAHLADRYGKKRFGMIGVALTAAGFGLLVLAGLLPGTLWWVVPGILVYGLGLCFFGSSWFALLSDVVPETMRGRFFGRLRTTWQVVGIGFAAVCTLFLGKDSPLTVVLAVMVTLGLACALRGVFYRRIPEQPVTPGPRPALIAAVRRILPMPNFMSFICYLFMLGLFTGCIPTVFGLVEKQAMNLGDRWIVILGNLTSVGALIGYAAGGRAVDRLGTKPVFLVCHFGYSLMMVGFLLRGLMPAPLPWLVLIHLGYGVTYAAASIAISTEMLALIAPDSKSLSTSLIMTLQRTGVALSGILSGWLLSIGVFSGDWRLLGMTMTSFDGVLLVGSMMVVLLIVTLGLVPSIIGQSAWYPRGQ